MGIGLACCTLATTHSCPVAQLIRAPPPSHPSPHPHTSLFPPAKVYRGTLEGLPIAVKRLRLPADATPAVVSMLQKRFRAELGTLSSFTHPRIVRLLHFCEDSTSAVHPFSLVFELLEEGSLADWLRGEKNEPPKNGTLTPLERVDAALGIAHGLAYLHGIDSHEGGGGGGGGGGSSSSSSSAQRSAAAEPTVHRDVKSANVGFTRIGGDLYAKVLDCGLAKAIRGTAGSGNGGGGGGGASFSSGVLGTPGYMA